MSGVEGGIKRSVLPKERVYIIWQCFIVTGNSLNAEIICSNRPSTPLVMTVLIFYTIVNNKLLR